MRYSDNIEVKGLVKNGFDYTLQVWIEEFIIQPCGHTDNYRAKHNQECCNGFKYAGQDIRGLLIKK